MAGNIGALGFTVVQPYIQYAGGWNGVMTVFGALFIASAFCWLRLASSSTLFSQCPAEPRGDHAAR